MAIYEKHISLDLSAEDSCKHISAKQGDYDSRYLRVTVLSDGSLFKIEENDAVALRCTHEDNTFDMDVGTINEDGTVSLKIPKSILSRIGSAECDVSIAREGCGLISTSCFYLSITKSSLTGNIDDGEDIKTPSELFAEMSANTAARHTHNDNLDVLNKITESEDGEFLFNGKAINQTVDIDSELSEESEKPVQNKVISKKINNLEDDFSLIKDDCEDLKSRAQMLEDVSHTHNNKAVLEKFTEEDGKVLFNGEEIKSPVDSELSSESESPVQNKVIKAELDKKLGSAEYLKEKVMFIEDWVDGRIAIMNESMVGLYVNEGVFDPKNICIGIEILYSGEVYDIFSLIQNTELIRKDTVDTFEYSKPFVFTSLIPDVFTSEYLIGIILDATSGSLIGSIGTYDGNVGGFYIHYLEGNDNDG